MDIHSQNASKFFGTGRPSKEISGKSNITGYVIRKLRDVPAIYRKVCKKRARKLRKLGEGVYWSVFEKSYVWEMRVGLNHYQRRAIRFYFYERCGVISDMEFSVNARQVYDVQSRS